MKKMTRMESNKEARRTLNRHGVDLTYCQFACYGHEVRLTGWLVRTDGLDFNGQQVEALIQDFRKVLPGFLVVGELENWNFTSEHISFLGNKDEASYDGGGAEEQVTYEIDLDGNEIKVS